MKYIHEKFIKTSDKNKFCDQKNDLIVNKFFALETERDHTNTMFIYGQQLSLMIEM